MVQTRHRLVLAASVLLPLASAGSPPACYYPNGEQAVTDFPCNLDSEESFCCATGYTCLENKICSAYETYDGADVSWTRGSCTDQSWTSPDCPQFCESYGVNNGDWLIQCSDTANNATEVCCYDPSAAAPAACCSGSNAAVFTLEGAAIAFNTIGVGASTITRATPASTAAAASTSLTAPNSETFDASSISTTFTTIPTSSNMIVATATSSNGDMTGATAAAPAASETSTSSGITVGTEAGIAVGVVGVIALAAIAAFFSRYRRRRRGKQLKQQVQGVVTTVEPYREKDAESQEDMDTKQPKSTLFETSIRHPRNRVFEANGNDVFEANAVRDRVELEERRLRRSELE